MNFSVHFDEETAARLEEAVGRSGLKRNRIVLLAVQEWLARLEEADWPPTLKAHFGNPAPELAEDALGWQAWRGQLAPEAEPRW